MKKILIIEDEEAMRQGLDDLLRSSGYESKALDLSKYLPQPQNIASIIDDIVAVQADLILLDINLAGLDGELILKTLRSRSEVPVIMVTSSGMEMDEVLSMSYGADDYITKPYNPQILLLRIAAVLKRFEGTNGPIKFHNLRVDLNKGVIESDQKRILLTKNEMIIFGHLLSHRGEIVTRDDLMTDLWNNHEYINDNALTVNVSRLRGKFKTLGMGEAIETRKGLGYILS